MGNTIANVLVRQIPVQESAAVYLKQPPLSGNVLGEVMRVERGNHVVANLVLATASSGCGQAAGFIRQPRDQAVQRGQLPWRRGSLNAKRRRRLSRAKFTAPA